MDTSLNEYSRDAHAHDDVETVVGPSVVVEGDFASEGNILVKGTVSGSVKTARLLTVETGAKIMANVKAGDAVVAGEVRGNVKVDQQLELTSSAKVLGDIQCQVLVVSAGALLQGKVNMKGLEGAEASYDAKKRPVRPKLKSETMEGEAEPADMA
ncbi:MAG: hypothetical protein UY92_C0002G0077 [Candidatus Magasanikbacteria bacterium GW2011_GWA2_56_11]|uniref:Integral membrane protein CcmA involved in cell shape determination n=1 Tax=Candidatus Magasanikbacteria bacterium GW2011_GWA2_56_11 TaxID=1619044 RepID=A0A0G1YIB0_9BACT|nr:MAG: hypothetical protein UY92_C0002G0077 [Candidatus Magasanikbacteria bacterium GW2011_GWA2_56_11]